ncbi:hypothetical protein SAMN04487819_105179 [Actinopolyspora alba]|uniref:Uncharacterized protein n=1 Tax=Actinopolyspora alba TaxID=673379 RepID=A0A1I1WD99_9ACTN|nr:hypothetical protein SAMN04487819_105179 [Actinopolyspora alba]
MTALVDGRMVCVDEFYPLEPALPRSERPGAQAKTGFATDSLIRTWIHYPTKVA